MSGANRVNRRAVLAVLLAPALAGAHGAREGGAAVAAALAVGEAALARGDTAAALQAFEQAAALHHAADIEMGLVRAWMQGGEYRRALAFCAHTAGGHRDDAAPGALYAWLLRLGGQGAAAQRVMDDTRTRWPADPVVSAAVRQFASAWPVAEGVLAEAPHRLAPYSAAPPAGRILGTGVRVGLDLALAPLEAGLSRVGVRDGLGRFAEAAVVQDTGLPAGLVCLRFTTHLGAVASLPVAARDPFAGSAGYTVTYGNGADGAPAWPWLHAGFGGGFDGAGPRRRLGIDVPAGARGGVLFDTSGYLAGLVDGAGWWPVSLLRPWLDSPSPAAPRAASDEVYERAMSSTLQVMSIA